ncbi:MAG: ATPase [Ruminococcus sp.]
MKVDDLILQLQDLINDAKSMPFSGGKVLVSSDEVYDIIDQIQDAMPAEVRQAKNIVADRKQILTEANRESESIIHAAEERRKSMLNQNEIVREAQARAREIIEDAKQKSLQIRKATSNYVDNIMKRTEETLTGVIKKTDESLNAQLDEVRKTRTGIANSQKKKD